MFLPQAKALKSVVDRSTCCGFRWRARESSPTRRAASTRCASPTTPGCASRCAGRAHVVTSRASLKPSLSGALRKRVKQNTFSCQVLNCAQQDSCRCWLETGSLSCMCQSFNGSRTWTSSLKAPVGILHNYACNISILYLSSHPHETIVYISSDRFRSDFSVIGDQAGLAEARHVIPGLQAETGLFRFIVSAVSREGETHLGFETKPLKPEK